MRSRRWRNGLPSPSVVSGLRRARRRFASASRAGGAAHPMPVFDVLAGQVARDTGPMTWHRVAADQPVEAICGEILGHCAQSGTE